MLSKDDFAVFILTYKRPDRQLTYNYLRSNNYTGSIYLVVDSTDTTIKELKNFIKHDKKCAILVFNKADIDKITDTGLSISMLNFAVFSRNAIEKFAKSLNYTYFVMCDDDIKCVRYRYLDNDKLKSKRVVNIDEVFNCIVNYMIENDKIAMLSPIQNIMSMNKYFQNKIYQLRYRECANMFFRNSSINVHWKLNMLEDVITSYSLCRRGYFVSCLSMLQCDCAEFGGKNSGGNSDVYNSHKHLDCIFPTIIMPDCFNVYISNDNICSRTINQNYLGPMLISDRSCI